MDEFSERVARQTSHHYYARVAADDCIVVIHSSSHPLRPYRPETAIPTAVNLLGAATLTDERNADGNELERHWTNIAVLSASVNFATRVRNCVL